MNLLPSAQEWAEHQDILRLKKEVEALRRERAAITKEYAASQAREQQLREAIQAAVSDDQPYINKCAAALSLPQDDTALRQWGAKLLREIADHAEAHIDYPMDQEDIDTNTLLAFHVKHLRRKADELEGKK